MATLIPADIMQPQQEVSPKNGKKFTIGEVYKLLDCDTVTSMELPDGKVMLMDEEAKMSGASRNHRAGEMVVFVSLREIKQQIETMESQGVTVFHDYDFSGDLDRPADYIAGDVIVCKQGEW